MNNLKIITSTTRPGSKGIAIASWITDLARQSNTFNVELLDLAVINLPFLDEPNHPRLQQYQHEHTKKWSAVIEEADAFIIVLAEYNHAFPAPLKNALDYLFKEWMYKPVAFVSYGGISAGLRSLQQLKPVVSALHMLPITESVSIPFFSKFINDEGEFIPEENAVKSAHSVIGQLKRYCEASKVLREKQ